MSNQVRNDFKKNKVTCNINNENNSNIENNTNS